MDCHESLMARRRKRPKNSAHRQKLANNGVQLDKSLPSLPPSAVAPVSAPKSAFAPDVETSMSEAYSDTPTEIPPRQRPSVNRSESPRRNRRDPSPASQTQSKGLLLNIPGRRARLICWFSRHIDPSREYVQEQPTFDGVKQVRSFRYW
jgi:hypothetical protein